MSGEVTRLLCSLGSRPSCYQRRGCDDARHSWPVLSIISYQANDGRVPARDTRVSRSEPPPYSRTSLTITWAHTDDVSFAIAIELNDDKLPSAGRDEVRQGAYGAMILR